MIISDSGNVLGKQGKCWNTAVSGVPITKGISYIEVIIGDYNCCHLGISKVTKTNPNPFPNPSSNHNPNI